MSARGTRSRLSSAALHTTLVLASATAVFPVAWVGLTSLQTDRNTWSQPDTLGTLGLGNYIDVLANTQFATWFANSLIVAAGTTALAVFIAATAGYAASRMRFPGQRPLMWMFLITQMFPAAVLIVPLYNVLSDLGLLNSYGGLILAQCTVAVPYCGWMLKGYFDTIPISIDEAGLIDGLSPFGTFWRLIVPLSKPGIAVTVFYSFITAWGEVAFASVFLQSEGRYTLPVGMATFVSDFTAEWGMLTAASMLVMIPAAVVFFLVQRHLIAGLTTGGVKS
ncbi:sugar ABC transporter permease [Haloechinothrix halophila]|uniref:sugar ABC transporter permease n=1 Tax=Haloechinothrix halophila TaxID=1069073 RepID=UPI000409F498|nr:carbohydrate ABC transporter permease [Haloechinothrix halophila]